MGLKRLGNVYFDQHDYASAIYYYQEALKVTPNNYVTYRQLGLAFAGNREFESAVEAFQQSIALNNSYELGYQALAEFYYEQELYDKALEVYKKWNRLQPGKLWAYYYLGRIYYQQERYHTAIVYLKEAVKNEPTHEETHYYLGCCYIKLGDWASADEAYQTLQTYAIKSCAKRQTPWFFYYTALNFRELFNNNEAADLFLQRYIEHSDMWSLFFGYMSLFEGGLTATIQEWEENPITKPIAEIEPFYLARKAIAQGRTDEALTLLEKYKFGDEQVNQWLQLEAEIPTDQKVHFWLE